MKIFYILRPYSNPSGFNVLASDKTEAIALANATFGYCPNTTAREIEKEEAGVLISHETIIPYEQSPLPNFKSN